MNDKSWGRGMKEERKRTEILSTCGNIFMARKQNLKGKKYIFLYNFIRFIYNFKLSELLTVI
jgi:hypothetical protein